MGNIIKDFEQKHNLTKAETSIWEFPVYICSVNAANNSYFDFNSVYQNNFKKYLKCECSKITKALEMIIMQTE